MKKLLASFLHKWQSHIVPKYKNWFYDVGVLLFGIGCMGVYTFPYFFLTAMLIFVGGTFVTISDRKAITKILTILLLPLAVIFLFIIFIFSDGSLLSILLLALLLTFPLLSKILVWINKKQKRKNWALLFLGILILAPVVQSLFFTKMEAIQSKTYPNMYFIKNPFSKQDSVQALIKNIVLKKMNSEFIGNEKMHKIYNSDSSRVWLSYDLEFYKYSDGLFGNGSSYFIDNVEDDGGPTSIHFLSNIEKDRMARFSINYCEKDTVNYLALLTYYQEREMKTDTLINKCRKQVEEKTSRKQVQEPEKENAPFDGGGKGVIYIPQTVESKK